MALFTDAAMVLYYDIDGDNADHNDWQTHEHLHERLSIPGFERASRWITTAGEVFRTTLNAGSLIQNDLILD